jgi:hypothetical protein
MWKFNGNSSKNPMYPRLALFGEGAHHLSMAKTWVPKGNFKSAKAFAKAMRSLLSTKGGRRQKFRP